ncbi:Spectrin beta chain, non-erythrocytic 1, partial [Cichlidogyrus casuarinus]
DKPEAIPVIKEERAKLEAVWQDLNKILKERDDRLNDSSELQHFLQDLDHFQSWQSKTQTLIASEDIPQSLQEAEKFSQEHQLLKTEIKNYEADFKRLMDYGGHVTEGQTDAQYMFLHQRLNGIAENWEVMHKMFDDRTKTLQQAVEAQTFFRDAHQIDVFLNKQENYLSKEDVPVSEVNSIASTRALHLSFSIHSNLSNLLLTTSLMSHR